MNPLADLLITVFLGPFGIHKFLKGKTGMGILYLCTAGLFGIGWLFDCIQAARRFAIGAKHNPKPSTPPVPAPKAAAPSKIISPTARNLQIFSADCIAACREKFIAFDLETTGLDSYHDRIVEISAVMFENFVPTGRFSTLVNPGRPIPNSASSIHGIHDEDVKDAPDESSAIAAFCNFIGKEALCGDVVLVAHNALFDVKFLLYALSRAGIEAELSFMDTLSMARRWNLDVSNKKLGTLAQHFSIEQNAAHRAEDDACVCGRIFVKMLEQRELETRTKFESLTPLEQQTIVWVKKILTDAGCNTDLLTFSATAYLTVNCLYSVIKFKPKAKRPYVLVDKTTDLPSGEETAPAVKSEGADRVRVFYQTPEDLDCIKNTITARYCQVFESALSFVSASDKNMKAAAESIFDQITV